MKKKNLELFETEWTILQKVWQLEPCAAPTVQESLKDEKGWAYTTVKTMMDRMVKKGLLETKKIRNLYLYSSAVTQSQARKSEIARTLKRAFDGTFTPMMQFLIENNQLSEEEYRHLEQLIEKRKSAKNSFKNKSLRNKETIS